LEPSANAHKLAVHLSRMRGQVGDTNDGWPSR
jgi:hypothetical protein